METQTVIVPVAKRESFRAPSTIFSTRQIFFIGSVLMRPYCVKPYSENQARMVVRYT